MPGAAPTIALTCQSIHQLDLVALLNAHGYDEDLGEAWAKSRELGSPLYPG